MVKPPLAGLAQAAREEIGVVAGVMHDAIRNDLLLAGVVLEIGARPVLGGGMDGAQDALETPSHQPMPGAVGEDRRTRHAEYVLSLMRTTALWPDGGCFGHALRHPAHSFTRDA